MPHYGSLFVTYNQCMCPNEYLLVLYQVRATPFIMQVALIYQHRGVNLPPRVRHRIRTISHERLSYEMTGASEKKKKKITYFFIQQSRDSV